MSPTVVVLVLVLTETDIFLGAEEALAVELFACA